MNEIKIHSLIKNSKKKICMDTLSKQYGCEIPARFLLLSQPLDTFYCPECKRNRHHVTGVSLAGWLLLWFFRPPKEQ